MKKVTRTWTTKDGKVHTKVYVYGEPGQAYVPGERRKEQKSMQAQRKKLAAAHRMNRQKLYTEKGNLRKKVYDYIKEQISNDKSIMASVRKANMRAFEQSVKINEFKNGHITASSIIGALRGKSIYLMIANTGWLPEELAMGLRLRYNEKVTGADLLNASNWNGRYFTSPYSGSAYYLENHIYRKFPMHTGAPYQGEEAYD